MAERMAVLTRTQLLALYRHTKQRIHRHHLRGSGVTRAFSVAGCATIGCRYRPTVLVSRVRYVPGSLEIGQTGGRCKVYKTWYKNNQ